MALEIIRESPFSDEITGIFRELVAHRVQEDQVDAVLTAGYSLASKRAYLFSRELFPLDVEYSLSLLCHWPLKPKGNEKVVEETRQLSLAAAQEVAHGNSEPLDELVPDATLLLPHETLYALQARDVVSHLEGALTT